MGLIATNSGGNDFELAPAGNHPAKCFQVIDLGMQQEEYMGVKSMKRKCVVWWELPGSLMKDGRPFVINKWYTVTTSEMGNMRPDFESWRGKDFTEDEIKSFEVFDVIGAACLLNCVAGVKQGGGNKITVAGITPLPAAMAHLVGSLHNPIQKFSVDNYNDGDTEAIKTFDGLADYWKNTINLTGQASQDVYKDAIGERSGPTTAGDLAQSVVKSEYPEEGQETPLVDDDLENIPF